MRIFNRGQHIVFRHQFYDSSGDLTSPDSASLYISYPAEGFPLRATAETTTLSMVLSTVGSTDADFQVWSSTWVSGQAYPGPVHWSVRGSDLTLNVADGDFTLRGNAANLIVTTTT
jgi:hypothetical protein